MSFILTAGGASRGYVRDCPPERGVEYTSVLADAVKFASEAEALAYLTVEHPIRKMVVVPTGPQPGEEPIIGTFTRQDKITLPLSVLNVGDM